MPLITVSAGTPAIPAGTYPASLVSVAPKRLVTQFSNPPGSEQDFLEWTWLVEGPERDIEITSLTSLATGPKSRIFEYLLAMVGPERAAIGAGFDEADLVGKSVMVSTVETPEGFAKIDKIVAAPKTRRGSAPTPAAAPVAESKDEKDDDLPF